MAIAWTCECLNRAGVIAFDAAGVHMLEGRPDIAVLWGLLPAAGCVKQQKGYKPLNCEYSVCALGGFEPPTF